MIRKSTRVLCFVLAALLLAFAVQILWNGPYGWLARATRSLLVGLVAWRLVAVGRSRRSAGARPPRRWRVALLLLLAIVMTGYAATIAYVDHQLAGRAYPDAYRGEYKVWTNRGFVPGTALVLPDGAQNSIEAIRRAFAMGAKGVEVDVFYDTERKEFIVSHDRPYNLKGGKLLTLAALFEAIGDEHWIWLDFKKLRFLDADELRGAVAALEAVAAKGEFKKRVYVEGEAPFALKAFQNAGFLTIMDTHPLPDGNPLAPTIANLYKAVFYFGGFTVMGMPAGSADEPIYGPRTQRCLGGIPVFLYHAADDPDFLTDLAAKDSVRVIMIYDHSVAYYRLRATVEDVR